MAIKWFSDPALLCEREDNRRACPCCANNRIEKGNHEMRFSCSLGFDQLGGSRTQQNCDGWTSKGRNK